MVTDDADADHPDDAAGSPDADSPDDAHSDPLGAFIRSQRELARMSVRASCAPSSVQAEILGEIDAWLAGPGRAG